MSTSKDEAQIMCRRCRCEWVEDRLCSAASFTVVCDPIVEGLALSSDEIRSLSVICAPAVESKVDHPSHYRADTGVEAITVIEAWGLNFNLGNVIKYISRAGHKLDHAEDLEKALWYLQREVNRIKESGDVGR